MSSNTLHEKITGHEIKAWYLASLDLEVDTLDGDSAWESFMDYKPVEFKAPKKPRAKKQSTPPSERAAMEFDETKCGARVWLTGGFAAQCSNKHITDQFLCSKHLTESAKHDGSVTNGFFNGDKPTHKYNDENNEVCWWTDQLEEWEKNKKLKSTPKNSSGKTRKAPKCSRCHESGHTIRTCAKEGGSMDDENSKMKKELAELRAALKQQAEKLVGDEVYPDPEPEPEPEPESEPESDAMEEDTFEYGGDEDDKDDSTIDCSLDGIKYTRDDEEEVYDVDFDSVGTWDGEKIIFNNMSKHTQAVKDLLIKGLESLKNSELKKRALLDGVSQEQLEEAEDSDTPREDIIELIVKLIE